LRGIKRVGVRVLHADALQRAGQERVGDNDSIYTPQLRCSINVETEMRFNSSEKRFTSDIYQDKAVEDHHKQSTIFNIRITLLNPWPT
jgi:hypothetical protein